jgi:uncharacterized membrane protein YraQ (UPF0718 family)/copper chaperone CopZ
MIELLLDYPKVLLEITAEMAPYLVLGFLMAGVVHQFFPKTWIKRHLGKGGFVQSFKASLFGVPLPVCSCGIIPLAKELKKSGASNAGVSAFLASTPQTGVDSVIATGGLLGWAFAGIRVLVAFVSGVLTGAFIGFFDKKRQPIEASEPTAVPKNESKAFSIKKCLYYGVVELPSDIRNSLLLGLVIAALISLFLPQYQDLISSNSAWISYLAVLALAIPLYVCSTGSIPIALALIDSGFSMGAALVFLVAGPATNIVTLITMTDIIGTRNTILYLLCVIGIALLTAGWIDMASFDITASGAHHHEHDTGITLLQWLCTAILLGGMAYLPVVSVWKKLARSKVDSSTLKEFSIHVEGMGCKKCAAKVTTAIESIPSHQIVSIDLENKRVVYEAKTRETDSISDVLAKEGYQLIND